MATLYDIRGQMLALYMMMDDPDIDPQVIADSLESVEWELEDKADAYAMLIFEGKADSEKIKAEADRMLKRAKAIDSKIERMKSVLEETMKATGKTKFKTEKFSFGIQKNAPSVKIASDVDMDMVPPKFLKFKDPEINKTLVKNALKEGETLDWAELVQTEGLRIR